MLIEAHVQAAKALAAQATASATATANDGRGISSPGLRKTNSPLIPPAGIRNSGGSLPVLSLAAKSSTEVKAAVPVASTAASVVAPKRVIGLKEMLPAVRALTGATGANAASSVATVKALPTLQQLVLLSASMAVAGSDAATAATREAEAEGFSAASTSYAVARAKKKANPFAEASAPAGGVQGDDGPPAPTSSMPLPKPRGGGILLGDAALRVPVRQVGHHGKTTSCY